MNGTIDYTAKKKLYEEDSVFDTLNVNINIDVTSYDGNFIYLISDISSDKKPHTSRVLKNISDEIDKEIEELKTEGTHSIKRKSWSSFYSFKEILDIVSDHVPDNYRLFYRGQSGNWPLEPTLFRDGSNGYSDRFRDNYDHIYESIANKFPDEIQYYDLSSSEDRASNLAVLQHYGLGTPLVDITENPFIAMLFMVNNYMFKNELDEPRLDIFFVNENGDNELFQEVKNKKNHNLRISAQKGAFLNFERLSERVMGGKNKIDRVCVNLKFKEVTTNISDGILPDDDNDSHINNGIENDHTKLDNMEIALTTAVKDIQHKLLSFHYKSEDLFPDFYKYLELLKVKYTDDYRENDSPWYEFSKNDK